MTPVPTSTLFFIATFFGSLAAYIAYRRGKNPYLYFFAGFLFGLMGIFFLFFAPNRKKEETIEPHSPSPTIRGPRDKFWYYLNEKHEQQGPISHEALSTAFNERKIGAMTYVWHEELTEWKHLKEFIQIN